MTTFEDYFVHQLKSLHDLQTHHLDGILATPRDIGKGPAPPLVWQDFRFKGYPDKSFQAPKIPKYKRMSLDLMNTDKDDQYFGKTTYFDKEKDKSQVKQAFEISSTGNENQYTVRDPLGKYTDNRPYGIRDPYGVPFNLTEEHKYKLQREMRDIEEDKKQREIIDKIRTEERAEEKRKFFEDLQRQPQDETRKQKFLETDLIGSPTPSYRERMRSWPIMNLEREQGTVTDRLRYNQDRPGQERYHQELERQRKEQELRRQEERLDNLQKELESLKHDPYNKPGGGAPNRSDSESFTERRAPMPSMESPRRAPPTMRMEDFRDTLGRSVPEAEKLRHINREVHPLYYPFGKAGGGAPVKDAQGNIIPQLQGNLQMENTLENKARDRARQREYYNFLKGQEMEQRRNKQEIEWHMKAPIGELAAIMGSKNVGKPVKDPYTGELKNHHLGNSDVSLQKMNYQPKAETEKKKYHEDLSTQTDERNRYRQLNRLKENQEGMLHHHTMDTFWGRPGGGAPKNFNLRKLNLENSIHHPTKDQTDEYIKKKDWSQVPQGNPFSSNDDYSPSPRFHPNKYVRSTVQSNHANLYEYPESHKDKLYSLSEPYATS